MKKEFYTTIRTGENIEEKAQRLVIPEYALDDYYETKIMGFFLTREGAQQDLDIDKELALKNKTEATTPELKDFYQKEYDRAVHAKVCKIVINISIEE